MYPIRSTRVALAGAAAVLLLGAAACSDDDADDDATTTTEATEASADFDVIAYCEAVEETNATDAPTVEQLERYREVAPEELDDEIEIVFPVFAALAEDDDPSGFDEEGVGEAIDAIIAVEGELCGTEDPRGPVDPELEPYCEVVTEVNQTNGSPGAELLERYQALAPEAIQDEVAVAVPAFVAAEADGSDPFADPAVADAVEAITAFELETCG